MNKELYKFDMSGLDNVYLANGFTWHDTPYGKAVHINNASGLTRTIAQTLLSQTTKIAGKEVRFLRTHFGLSQPDLGKMLGKDAQTIARWEKSGRTAKATEMLARLIFAGLLDGNQTIQSMVHTLNAIDQAKHARIIVKESKGAWHAMQEAADV